MKITRFDSKSKVAYYKRPLSKIESEQENEKQEAFRRALNYFSDRLGVNYMELSQNVELQKIAKRNLMKEKLRLHTKYMNKR